MSFFFSTSKSKNEKVKQVERLLNAIPDVTRIDSTGSKFQCMLITPGAVQRSSIMITLLDQFPLKAPIVSVMGPLRHPWVDSYRFVIGCASLNQWTEASSLADVISEIKLVLEAGYVGDGQKNARPPPTNAISEVTSIDTKTLKNGKSQPVVATKKPAVGDAACTANPSTTAAQVPTPHYDPFPAPEIPTVFPTTDNLSDEQLQRLLSDEVAFDVLLKEVFTDPRLETLANLRKNNYKLAKETAKKKQKLIDCKRDVEELQEELAKSCERYEASLQDVPGGERGDVSLSLEEITAQLKDKESMLEGQSDAVGQSFMDGNTNVHTFLKEYHSLQKRIYALRAKQRAAILSR